ncbi:MAG: T9SS type A sorting domain-containing protein [Chitinophagales bacterium]
MKFQGLTLFLICLFFGMQTTFAQAQRNCAAMDRLEVLIEEDARLSNSLLKVENHTRSILEKPQNMRVDGVITIPVVVHVIYSNSNENISEAQIQSQINVLNQDFRRTNPDANNTWSQADDVEIEFCLASVAPDGTPTTGITRKSSNTSSWGTNDAMKSSSQGGVDAWPTGDYLNMWICNIGGGILGYAQFPGGSAATDGVVMGPQYFGTTGYVSSPFDGGRTTTHEVGHWLNLRHIWGDGNCNADDFVSDTPTSDAANYGCATGHTSCNSTDMVQNYMDYSDDSCMNLFTSGQKARMRALFDNGGFRASLLNSDGCGNAGPLPTCDDGIMNGSETGIDCGGSSCEPCPCNGTNVTVSITLDQYGSETTWAITDANGAIVASGGPYSNGTDGTTVTASACLADGCYDFTINDEYSDGICCGYGDGSYTVSDGSTLASGGQFAASETTNFCVGNDEPTPTCDDGVMNGNETGVDCGGDCDACATCDDGIMNGSETGVDCGGDCDACATCDDGVMNGNETGVDCGGDCDACATCDDGIMNGSETGVDCGGDCDACATCDDGVMNGNETGVDCGGDCDACVTPAECDTPTNIALTFINDTKVRVTWDAMPDAIKYQLRYRVQGSNSWKRKNTTLTYRNAGNLAAGTTYEYKLRTRCSDGWTAYSPIESFTTPATRLDGNFVEETTKAIDLNLYPNPVSKVLTVEYDTDATNSVNIQILDITGRQIMNMQSENDGDQVQFNVANLQSGYYFIQIDNGKEQITEKFIVFK